MKQLMFTISVVLTLQIITGKHVNEGDKTKYKSCDEARLNGHKESGIYKIWFNDTTPDNVLCSHAENNSVVVILRRMHGNIPFEGRTWNGYLYEFGDPNGDYWAGLNKIYYYTSQAGYSVLTIHMQDWAGNNRNVRYAHFKIVNSVNFQLSISGYSGDVPDDMQYCNGRNFATPDRPDAQHCAINQRTGWWFNYCAHALPTGHYYPNGPYQPKGGWYDGIYWLDWLGSGYSLRYIDMVLSQT